MPSLTTSIITAIENTQTGYSTKTHLQIDQSIFVSYGTHAMICYGPGTQDGEAKKKSLISSHLDLMLGQ